MVDFDWKQTAKHYLNPYLGRVFPEIQINLPPMGRPGAHDNFAVMFVKGPILDVHGAGGLGACRGDPHHCAYGVHQEVCAPVMIHL